MLQINSWPGSFSGNAWNIVYLIWLLNVLRNQILRKIVRNSIRNVSIFCGFGQTRRLVWLEYQYSNSENPEATAVKHSNLQLWSLFPKSHRQSTRLQTKQQGQHSLDSTPFAYSWWTASPPSSSLQKASRRWGMLQDCQ